MRFVSALAGILFSVPVLLFFLIGSQTFISLHERVLARALTVATATLLVLSLVLIFNPAVQRWQISLLGSLAVVLAAVVVLVRSNS